MTAPARSRAMHRESLAVLPREESQAREERIAGFDAARGIAMLFVCLSHFSTRYFQPDHASLRDVLATISMIASPTFVAISGIMLGLLVTVKEDAASDLLLKLVDRALFILIVGHNLIFLALIPASDTIGVAARQVQMTDTIAVCLIVGVFLVRRVSARARLTMGILLFLWSWMLVVVWHPSSVAESVLDEVAIGALHRHVLSFAFPVLPWLGVYLACTAFGDYLGRLYREGRRAAIERALLVASVSAVALSVVVRVSRDWIVPRLSLAAQERLDLGSFFSPWVKFPPSPGYLLFFGGIGLGMTCFVLMAAHRRPAAWWLAQAARVGRCSLSVFIVQFFVYYALIGATPLEYAPAWPLLFAATIGGILLFARFWDKHRLNGVLTVGLRALRARRRSGDLVET